MKINKDTKYSELRFVEPYLEEDETLRIEDAAVQTRFGKDGFYAMTLGDFFAIMGGDTETLTKGMGDDTVFAVYLGRAFDAFVDFFIERLKSLTLPPTPESMRTSQGCLDVGFDESVYVFCREYFNLHTFADVEALKVADYIMARKDAYNRAVVERNMAASIKKGAKA